LRQGPVQTDLNNQCLRPHLPEPRYQGASWAPGRWRNKSLVAAWLDASGRADRLSTQIVALTLCGAPEVRDLWRSTLA